MKRLIIVLLLCLCPKIYSQNGRIFSADSELSSSLINDIHPDHKGFIWIATEDGLNRYDGAKFINYKHDKKDSTSILNNYVKTIFEDSDKNLYFGFFNGLQIYNRGTDSFKQISLSLGENDAYDAHVRSIIQRQNGDILIGTSGQGIFILRENDEGIFSESLLNLIPTAFIDQIFEDSSNNLWFLSPQNGLFCLNEKSGKVSTYFNDSNIRASVSVMGEDAVGNLYVGSYNQGLFKFNAKESSFTRIPNTKGIAIHSLFLDSNKDLLVGTDGDGLFKFDPRISELEPNQITASTFDFSKSKVHAIEEDKNKNIWLGLYQKGVTFVPNKINDFNYIGYRSNSLDMIGSNCVMAVLKDSEGILWVGTDGDGLYSISPSNEVLNHYKDQNYLSKKFNTVVTIFEDSNKDLWIGTYLNGLMKIDRKTLKPEFIDSLTDEDSNPVRNIYSIVEDDNKMLWLGSLGSGLFRLNLADNSIEAFNVSIADQPKGPAFFNNKWINDLLIDESINSLYIASYDGISRFNLKDKRFDTFPDGINKFHGQIIYTLHKDDDGVLWAGSANGLVTINDQMKELKRYTIDDGLPSNTICSIEEDKNNNLWISTNHGISEFNLDRQNFLNYYFNDGLQGNEFSKNASYLYKEEQLFFGGMNGITYFDPSEIVDKVRIPEILITDIYLQNKPILKGSKSGSFNIADKAIVDADTIQLSYKDNSFSVELSSLEYGNPKRVSYSYSLNNSSWINLPQGVNTLAFENLKANTYNFKLRAKDYEKYSEIKQFTVIIHPLWYLTTTALIAYFLIFLLFTFLLVYELRQRQKRRNELRELSKSKQINEAKLQFLTNISHDIRTPLTLIFNPLKKLIKEDHSAAHQKSYKTIFRNTDRILQLTNQLLDIRKIDDGHLDLKFEKIELIAYIQNICLLFEDQIDAKKIQFDFKHKMPILFVWIDPNYFDKIIQNLLANAMKFVEKGGKVELILTLTNAEKSESDESYFQIEVVDDGIGLEKGMEDLVFDRFYQNKSSAHHLQGTGIGLHLTRSIAELHKGTIYAENNKNNEGSRFVICIPLNSAHLNLDKIQTNADEPYVNDEIDKPKKEEQVELHSERESNYASQKVLIVDDDSELRNFLEKDLSTIFNVIVAKDGKEALDLALKQQPDLIISDIMMPVMDGMQLCRKIKKNININHTPIILLTAKTSKDNYLESLNLGADAYIPKPFDIKILKRTAINLIDNRKLLKNNYDGSQLQEDKVKHVTLKSSDEILLEKIMACINENFNNPDLNVETIASTVGISRVHLYRKLKELTNQSASDLIRNIRLKQAAKLLSSKQISIAEVAYAVGYSNMSTFSTNFKNLYGISPKKYHIDNLPEHDSKRDT
ncbi:two-component regulator propeller domain-containing protein [Flavimarina sp. Hel_I_48]|uniref:hybrid sensor histidine kinase/response regulator transcription factor n=1 Tax=Flavimarina sp. Hel_I_48 TaxID=1392488 RepID=UPI000A8B16C9|nr:two-component regulator propeller domain-containing protein [Flavimarina sp. Hel_I_48]